MLPKYAKLLGASDPDIGIYLGASYAAIAVGTAVAGWLADRVERRRTWMVLVTLAITPLLIVTSQVTVFWQVVVLTAAIWWFAGMALAFASILAGLGAGTQNRGRVLGILAVAAPTGSIIGGLGIGVLADRVGFASMWILLGLLYLLCPATGLLIKEVPGKVRRTQPRADTSKPVWGTPFLILLVCGVLAAFGSFIGALGRSLVMLDTFSSAELTSTVAASGIATLPFPFLVGTMSDRLGRLRFLALCYGAGIAGLIVYSGATALWQFWLASALVAFVSYVSTGVGSALVVDLVDRRAIGRGLAWFSATGWTGGILGFAVGGFLFPTLGAPASFLLGAGLVLITLALLLPIAVTMRAKRRRGSG